MKGLNNGIIKLRTQRKDETRESQEIPKTENTKVDKNKQLAISDNMTKDELVEQARRQVFYEEMDWEPMKAEEIILEVLALSL